MWRAYLAVVAFAVLVGCGGDDANSQAQDVRPDGPAEVDAQPADADAKAIPDTLDARDTGETKYPTDTQDPVDTSDTADPLDSTSDTTDPLPSPWPPTNMTEVPGATPFFIDQYEWPNQAGQQPLGYVASKDAAASICAAVNKRLCSHAELAAACAPAATAYPYGATYAPAACNTELPYEADPCGANADCHAPAAAAFDLVGNVAEWASDGTLFGGSVLEGLQCTCSRFATPAQDADPRFFGLRCCLAATDDLDQDGSPAALDCNDGNGAIHPAAPEACNSLDDDCDGATDNTADQDKDGFNSCADCNDNAFSIHPGAPDEAGDKVDADCDGKDGSDNDSDGYFAGTGPGLDCNDQDGDISPAATELCNHKDDDCDGATDEDLAPGICDDGNPCTDDQCNLTDGTCGHVATSCSDDSPCTDDTCDPASGCVFSPLDGACDDANPCTLQDACLGGLCLGMTNTCDDQNPCTGDSCDPLSGTCNHDATEGPCQDADPCSLGDFCQDGQCKAGPELLDCTDPNPCTDDACTAGQGCLRAAVAGPCDDGDSCTSSDMCSGTVCTGLNQCACAIDDECQPLNDADWCNGTLYCNTKVSPAFCEVDPASVVTCNTAQDSFCQAKICDPLDAVCKLRPRNEGLPCDAPCTANPTCQAGQCKGTACASQGQACAGGKCISNTCTSSTTICDGDFATLTCDADGQGWSSSVPCGPGKYCDQGTCRPQVCTPHTATCVGRLAGTCDSRGAGLVPGYANCEALPETPYCAGGACDTCAPACDNRQCGPDGCGGLCGTCAGDEQCQEDGQCQKRCGILEGLSLSEGIHACVLTGAGNISCWGQDGDGKAIEAIGPFKKLAAGYSHTCAIKTDNTVQCWGNASVVSATPSGNFESISAGGGWVGAEVAPFTCGIRTDGSISCWGKGSPTVNPAQGAGPLKKLDCSALHCCAIKADDTLHCWGSPASIGTVPAGKFTEVTVGALGSAMGHSCALDQDGKVTCFGNNAYGQLNVPANLRLKSISGGGQFFCGLTPSNEIACWGGNQYGNLNRPLGQFKALDAGALDTCAIGFDNRLKCWGYGIISQNSVPQGRYIKAEVGYGTLCFLRDNGTGFCTGPGRNNTAFTGGLDVSAGGHGWNGSSNAMYCTLPASGIPNCYSFMNGEFSSLLAYPTTAPLKAISADGHHACGITDQGLLTCWGAAPTHSAPANTHATLVSTSYWFNCALKADQSAVCWGSPEAVAAHPAAGTYNHLASFSYTNNGMAAYTCAVRPDASGACWGSPNLGQLAVPAGPWKMIIPSALFACGLKTTGELLCWGNHTFGTSLSGRYTTFDLDVEGLCAVTTTGDRICYHGSGNQNTIRADTCVD